MRFAVLHDEAAAGGRVDEADALVQAQSISGALSELGHECRMQAVSLNLAELVEWLRRARPDLVFNLVESLAGHGRLIHLVPATLDALGVRYTGAGSVSMLLSTHKPLAKAWLHQSGVATPAWHSAGATALRPLSFPCRCIVKPVWEDASVGIDDAAVREVAGPEDIDGLLQSRGRQVGGEVFMEEFVEGREFNLSLLAGGEGPQVLPPAEIEFVDYPAEKPRIVGYAAKWHEGSFENRATQRRFGFSSAVDVGLLASLSGTALLCWRLFGLRGYARVDFRVDSQNRAWVLEVNANPCLSPDAGFVAAARQAGLGFREVVSRIVRDALREAPERAALLR